MKIITEDLQSKFVVEEILNEATGKKDLFISGVFMQEEIKNRNGRIYPSAVMERAATKYISKYVNTNRALGELNHPPSIQVNPERVSHIITELRKEGNNWIGKAKILDTPMGQIVRGIVEGGGELGVSTRGVGSLKESNGVKIVQDDFALATIDIVSDPSAHDAWVSGIYESFDYEWKDDKIIKVDKEDISEDIDLKDGDNKEVVAIEEEDKTKEQVKAFDLFMDKLTNL